jgi:peptidoglycan/xylan/chitin deacetylase (PgdA/CDA1 family)
MAHGIMFHHFYDDSHPRGQGAISGSDFEEVINHLKTARILSADVYLEKANAGKLSANELCLTFDDSLKCQFDIAYPILKKHRLTAFWFVYTSVLQGKVENLEVYRYFRTTYFPSIEAFYEEFFSHVEESKYRSILEKGLSSYKFSDYRHFPHYSEADCRFRFIRDHILGPRKYSFVMEHIMRKHRFDSAGIASKLWMNTEMLTTLHEEGHLIGMHSHSHPTTMGKLSVIKQEQEYKKNFKFLYDLLGQPPKAMSHPCNSYNNDTLQILKKYGVELGFRSNMALKSFSRYEHPRQDHSAIMKEMFQ